MKTGIKKYCFVAAFLIGLIPLAGCGETQLNTRAPEEILLDEGYANRMYHYGDQLAANGRLLEAHAAYYASESMAYTSTLRKYARIRRMYLEQVIKAYENGETPPEPPIKPPPPTPKEKTTQAMDTDRNQIATPKQKKENCRLL